MNNDKKFKSILMTGGTGFVGSHMIDFLLKAIPDTKIYAIKRQRSDIANVVHLLDDPRLEFIEADLLDQSSLMRAIKISNPTLVYHFAAQSAPQASFSVPKQTLETNIIGTYNLLEALNILRGGNIDPVIISVSSSEVYGNPLPSEVPIDENNKIRAANPYSISKVGHDLLSQYFYNAFKMKIIITRLFSHEGARRGRDFALSNFARQIAIAEKLNAEKFTIKVGNLESIRTYVHISDAIEAYYLAAIHGVAGQIYNIGGSNTLAVGEALEYMLNLSKLDRKIFRLQEDPNLIRPTDITLQIPNYSKFQALTGWAPKTTIKEVSEDILNYWRNKV